MTSSVKKSTKTEPKKASPSRAIVNNHKRKTNLLQDNSWIKQEPDEDNQASVIHVTQSCPASPGSSVNDLAKRFGGGQEVLSKESPTLTTASKTASFGKIITPELGQDVKSAGQNLFLPGAKYVKEATASAEQPTSNKSSFSARVFLSSKLPHDNATPLIRPKASPITHSEKDVVDAYSEVTTESTAPVSLNPPQANTPPPIRCVTERGLCSYCYEPLPEAGAKIILENLQICSHTTCFKCEVCYCPLGDLEEGSSMWILKGKVHCYSCFNTTRDKRSLGDSWQATLNS